MPNPFARRTAWNLTTNRYTQALEAHRLAGRALLDLTASNPTTVGIQYREELLLPALTHREGLQYEPEAKGLRSARESVAEYYAERGSRVEPDDLILTTSTSEAYSYVFRLLCDPGDVVLVPTPSYPLFDLLADIQDVRLSRYELVYDHGWQLDFTALRSALATAAGSQCRAVLVVHPNNPTGSYVKPKELVELNRFCAENGLAIIADEVFLDYNLSPEKQLTFSENCETLTFTLSGLSKISALPQMKVAWVAVSGPQKTDAMARLEVIADTYLSMNAPVQLAVPTMLSERHGIQQQLLERVCANLRELDSQLTQHSTVRRLKVEGGWYAILRVPATESDEQLAIDLLEQTGVLVQPGHFYDFPVSGYLVVSLIAPQMAFQEGVGRVLSRFPDMAWT